MSLLTTRQQRRRDYYARVRLHGRPWKLRRYALQNATTYNATNAAEPPWVSSSALSATPSRRPHRRRPLPPFPPLGTYPSSFQFFPPLSSPFLGRWSPLSGSAFANHHPHLTPPQPPRRVRHYTPPGTYPVSGPHRENRVLFSLASKKEEFINFFI